MKKVNAISHMTNPVPEVIHHENPGYYKDNQISTEEHYERTGRIYTGEKAISKDTNFFTKVYHKTSEYRENPESILYDSKPDMVPFIEHYLRNNHGSLNTGYNLNQTIKSINKESVSSPTLNTIRNIKSPITQIQQPIIAPTAQNYHPQQQLPQQQFNQNQFVKTAVNDNKINPNRLLINKEKLKEKLNSQMSPDNNSDKNKNKKIFSENIYKKKTVKY